MGEHPLHRVFPLVLYAIVRKVLFRKVLIDGGSALNLLFAGALKELGLGLAELTPSDSSFWGVVPSRPSKPLGEITLLVQFGTASNYRVEHINFYVTDFDTAYHAILGRPALAKFMAVPHYAYLVMKMPTSPLPTPARQRVSRSPKPSISPSRWLAWSSKPRQRPPTTWKSQS